MLVEGRGLAYVPGSGNSLSGAPVTLDSLAVALRTFAGSNRGLLMADTSELVLNRAASGQIAPDVWQVVFDRSVAGVPVAGDRYLFAVSHGNLVQFGASRWSSVTTSPIPELDPVSARDRLYAYMGLTAKDTFKFGDGGTLQYIPMRIGDSVYAGPMGGGYRAALAWRISLNIASEPGTWVGLVDAHTGNVLAFYDDNDYAQAKGGVFPVSNDGILPDGVEYPGYPMPFTNITIGASTAFASSSGGFSCSPSGSSATTSLQGQYIKVVDTCGAISKAVTCDNDLDMGVSAGTDCTIPAGGGGPGNTHSARSSFYHLNRIAEHGRSWLPANAWLTTQVTDNVNLNQTCNAYWSPSSGTLNFFHSGGGCANTGEIAGVFLHEWGHGLDQNDGGGTDNPGEAYGDTMALMSTHVSCIGRGFEPGVNCGGYGNACLNCTGIRDQDWDKRNNHTPSTPAGFISTCSSGTGPCGKEVHCEGYLAAETMWDLANRDLPAAGLDTATAWQLADKLWFKSRNGSGGNAYNCSIAGGTSDGCAATSWFSKIRVQDDDDGNLANGTPHAAAIFAAFDRHKIACGLAADASNQNTSSCPSLAAPVLSATAGSSSASLSWTSVGGAVTYRVLRTDGGCDTASTTIATPPSINYTDTGLANGFTEYYHVQAMGSNPACEGVLSNCVNATPQPFAGTIKFDSSLYSCTGTISVSVLDANIGSGTTTVNIKSTTEPAGETITLTETPPGSANYQGSIGTTTNAPGSDGLLSIVNGDTITGTYIDADDGQGGINLTRTTTAGTDCAAPVITNVASSNVTGNSARITWNTDENADSVAQYGLSTPPGSAASSPAQVMAHQLDVIGLAECSSYFYSVQSTDGSGNSATDDASGAYYTFTTGKNVQPNYPSTDTPKPIPDVSTMTSAITVVESKVVQDVNVTVNLTHTYDSDIAIKLIGPNAVTVNLSLNHGSSGDNYTNTVFDDEASTPISGGTAPFTGSFRPDQPLSTLDGILSSGTWTLQITDSVGQDSGNLLGWTLSLTYPNQSCGPHAVVNYQAPVADVCSTGGPGNGNSIWEAGENVQFRVNLTNDGTVDLTGVSAKITSSTPGVTMIDGNASYPDIPLGGSADSIGPHFTAHLPTSLACGSSVAFQVTVNAYEGSFLAAINQNVGVIIPAGGTALDENFSGGIPATWTVIDGGSGGAAGATTWTTANPGNRTDITAPLSAPVAMVDSDKAGSTTGITQDEELITPALNLLSATTVTLDFDQFFRWFSGGLDENADVDVRSTATAGAWVNVLHQHGASTPNPDHKTINVTAQAAGTGNFQVRFHYWNGHFEWYWQVDNVKVTFTAPSGCNQNVCVAAPTSMKPVPDGSFGTAMTASRNDPGGTQIGVTWDVSTCVSTNYHVLYGDLATVSSYAIGGSACAIGTSGTYGWSGVPAGDLWFVIAADDGTSTEGSWGLGAGGERGGVSASGQCSMATRDNSGSCP
jgi:subtilisin-like proprotein convertase family protein